MKLVEVAADDHDLMPKVGEESTSSFVEVDFQNQLSQIPAILKSLNPIWNHKLVFDFNKTKNYHYQSHSLEKLLRIFCSYIARKSEEAHQVFPLDKKLFLSLSIKGAHK